MLPLSKKSSDLFQFIRDKSIYEPREDSLLLQREIQRLIKKNYAVLDMGTGSGILALEAAKFAKQVTAVDVNKKALEEAAIRADKHQLKNITFLESDLFANLNEKFNLIIFNPPYLPDSELDELRDVALDGGKEGNEVIDNFLHQARPYLADNGRILLLFSSLSGDISAIAEKRGFNLSVINEEKLFMETLYVALLW